MTGPRLAGDGARAFAKEPDSAGRLASTTRCRSSDASFRRALVDWYKVARRDLPWRHARDPYAIWVSETMLQQTRTRTVLPYYERFMSELPSVHALAEATEARVLALWSGLGYYRRARMLHAAARQVVSVHGGRFPHDLGDLRRLDGVGAYTAGAIASIAFGRRAPLVDGNVARVLARVFAIDKDVKTAPGSALLWALAARLVGDAEQDPGDWNQALMELGATVCTPRDPGCPVCPARAACLALSRGLVGQLPRVQRKAAPRVVHRVAVVLASSGSVLLARRTPGALFGGLWEPPGSDGPMSALAAGLGIDERCLELAGEVVHVLTHRRMHVGVARGPLPRREVWPLPGPDYDAIERVRLSDLSSRGHSSLARKILTVANLPARDLLSKK
jgi:A/G-specific adenine glycosylase